MQEVDHHLRATAEWETLFFLLAVAHLYGDCNPAADLISRQRWPEFRQLCALLGIRPRQVPLSPSALALIDTATVSPPPKGNTPAAPKAAASVLKLPAATAVSTISAGAELFIAVMSQAPSETVNPVTAAIAINFLRSIFLSFWLFAFGTLVTR